jgi:beta-phosphoglucomutase
VSNFKAVIFDLDGVIIESEHLWTKADLALLKDHGIDIALEEYEKKIKHTIMGLSFPEGVPLIKKLFNLEGEVEDLIEKRKVLVKEALQDVQLIKGFLDFHKSIKGKYKTAVATALVRHFLDPMILKFNLNNLFGSHIYSVEDIGFISKPNPDIYLLAAKKLGVDPKDCIGIEDSPHGVTAVNRAGMKSIALTTTTDPKKLSHASLIVNSYEDIHLEKLP